MATYVNTYATVDAATGSTHAVASVAVQAGDAIFVFGKWEDATGLTPSVSDNASGGSNTYTNRQTEQNASGPCMVAASAIAKATETLTVTVSTGSSVSFRNTSVVVMRPGASKTFAYDNSDIYAENNFGGEITTGAFATAGVGGAAAMAVGEYAASTYTQGAGWTESLDSNNYYTAYRVLTTETSIEGNATPSATMKCVVAAIAFKEEAAAGTTYSAGASTGIQNYIGFQANQIGIHRNIQPGIAYFNAQGFAPSTSSGFQIDAATGYANFVGYGAQAIQDSVGIAGRINFNTGTHQTHVTRQFFGLLGQLRALGFLVDQTNSQGFFPSLGNVYFQGPTGATVTVFSAPTTFIANALLRETHFVGFQAQLIRDFFPISANTHALGFTPQYVEFIKEITGPDQGEVNFSGFQAQAIILGQINDAIAQRGQVNLVGFQHAVDMWRTLDSLQGRINMQGFAAGIALFQGGTINLSGLTGEINFDTLQQAIGMYRTFYPDSGLTNAEGYVPVPSTGTLVQSIVGLLNHEGFVPFIVAERYRGIVGEMRLEGFAPTIGGGLWTPKRRRATSWAAIN